MSLHHNPKIVTDGLVLAYDMDNAAKSWKGKPTTNLFDNPVFATGTRAPWNYQTTANGDNSIDTSFTYEGFNTAKIVRTSTGGEANYWVNSSSVVSGDINPNTEYTFSAYAYSTVSNQAALFSYFGTQSSGFAFHPGGGKWVRLSHTFTSRSTSPYIQLRMWSDTTTLNTPVYFTKLQLEEGSFATPFVNGTRSNTQALLDMSKSKNTITATSLTYNSDGTFEFEGAGGVGAAGDYLSCGNSSDVNFGTGNFTLSFFANRTATGYQGGSYVSKGNGTSLGFDFRDSNFYVHGSSGLISSMSFNPSQNSMNHHTFVFDRSSSPYINYYLNGEYSSSSTTNNSANIGSSIDTTRDLDICRSQAGGVNRYFNGTMPIVKLYNRALTSAEIKQNFHATRRRFGI